MGMASRTISLKDGQRCVLIKSPIFPLSLFSSVDVYNIICEDGQYIIIYCKNNEIVARGKFMPNTTYYRSISNNNRHSLESGEHDIPWMIGISVSDNGLHFTWDEIGCHVTQKIHD